MIPQQGNNPPQDWIMTGDMMQPIKIAPIQPMKKVATQPYAHAVVM